MPSEPPLVDPLHPLLDRPREQRLREYQYRFAQSVVFGLPVLALEVFGRSLGGKEADRWVAVFQAVLTGWVVYAGAAGMLFEALILLARRRLSPDLVPALATVVLYLLGLVRTASILLHSDARSYSTFHWVVMLLMAWAGVRWWLMRDARCRR